ncbi:MAG: hypothetical protein HN833_05010 [Elusimicrobiaceae bacterium]|jgi:hypothetical protein|nr:hypothetical protein [Elusimicrobiaceae bacterium]MBT3954722.1 hypothetical protein [Elusimicrobiaceae bacterium]MBT4008630.1 hypothetical protein [Elusimicrobiaceae bacterium]MBT4402460.1 hypothetical protein [Elusimicrobiaceae bacterium]MBT4439392.1 hypothetical protein [Elusimicrobiaceae bacterium]
MFKKILIFNFIMFISLLSFATENKNISVSIGEIPEDIQLAREFNINVETKHPNDLEARINISKLNEKNKYFSLTNVEKETIFLKNNFTNTNFNLTLVPFTLGVSTLTAFCVDFYEQDNLVSGPNPKDIPLTIKPTKPKVKAKGLIDIYSPYKPLNWALILIWVGVLSFLGILAYYISNKFFKKKEIIAKKINADRLKNISPYQLAHDQLNGLTNSCFWQEKQYKKYFYVLSGILRKYLTSMFEVNAYQKNTTEVLRQLRTKISNKMTIRNIREFLLMCDLVKFSKYIPPMQYRDKAVVLIRKIIEDTRVLYKSEGEENKNAK